MSVTGTRVYFEGTTRCPVCSFPCGGFEAHGGSSAWCTSTAHANNMRPSSLTVKTEDGKDAYLFTHRVGFLQKCPCGVTHLHSGSSGHAPHGSNGHHVIDEGPSWPDPVGEDAYHGLAGDIVRAIDPHTESDPVAVLMQLLVGFGSLIGRGGHFVVEADWHYCNLFAVQVADTAKGRKGTSWGRVRRLLAEADPDWAASCIVGGLSSGEGLIGAVKDPQTKVSAKGELYVVPGVDDKRLLVHESEFASVMKQAVRENNILSTVLRQAWETGNLRNMTVDGRRATRAHISLNGHITRDELLRQITETDAANGFGNRFLWYLAQRSKLLSREGGNPT